MSYDQNTFLLFDNAVLAFIGIWATIRFATFLRDRFDGGGWRAVADYLTSGLFRNRGTAAEMATAIFTLSAGIALRAVAVWYWRLTGRAAESFPQTFIWIGDIVMVVGFLCMIRILDRRRPRNWPWIVALIGGVAFGVASTFLD